MAKEFGLIKHRTDATKLTGGSQSPMLRLPHQSQGTIPTMEPTELLSFYQVLLLFLRVYPAIS